MDLRGNIAEHGTNRKEKKDETEYTHKLKVVNKGDFSLTLASWDRKLMEDVKQAGMYIVDPDIAEITVTVQLKVRKEKYDPDTENVKEYTGNPWFTLKRILNKDQLSQMGLLRDILDDEYKVMFV